jgi:hypothetical protein
LLGLGGNWRTSPEDCPDGVFLLVGEEVVDGQRIAAARTTDLASTLCYLLGLPVAQYMEGRVMVECVSEEVLATRPLWVVD